MTPLGSLKDAILLETSDITPDNLPDALAILRGCWKASSVLWLCTNGFPVLSGLFLGGWSKKGEEAVFRFCKERRFSELLVRIEKPGQRWTRRRGGYTIPLGGVQGLVESLTNEGMIAILLEPASPYTDTFSLTSICDVDTGKIDLEVVGPGFDASDILRSDVIPHERFELLLDSRTTPIGTSANFQTRRTLVVDSESYRATVRRRLIKIGARLQNPSFPDEMMPPGTTAAKLEDLAENAKRYLRNSGQTGLLDHADHYEQIPTPLLDVYLGELLRLFRAISVSDVSWKTFSLAASFVRADRLVFWDFFPTGDYDTRTLSDLHAAGR
jgi:hypothetical protein